MLILVIVHHHHVMCDPDGGQKGQILCYFGVGAYLLLRACIVKHNQTLLISGSK